MTVRVRHDKYLGWRLYVDGCPEPQQRMRMMFREYRVRGWDRRASAAVALHTVFGWERARRYLVRRDWSPGADPVSVPTTEKGKP